MEIDPKIEAMIIARNNIIRELIRKHSEVLSAARGNEEDADAMGVLKLELFRVDKAAGYCSIDLP